MKRQINLKKCGKNFSRSKKSVKIDSATQKCKKATLHDHRYLHHFASFWIILHHFQVEQSWCKMSGSNDNNTHNDRKTVTFFHSSQWTLRGLAKNALKSVEILFNPTGSRKIPYKRDKRLSVEQNLHNAFDEWKSSRDWRKYVPSYETLCELYSSDDAEDISWYKDGLFCTVSLLCDALSKELEQIEDKHHSKNKNKSKNTNTADGQVARIEQIVQQATDKYQTDMQIHMKTIQELLKDKQTATLKRERQREVNKLQNTITQQNKEIKRLRNIVYQNKYRNKKRRQKLQDMGVMFIKNISSVTKRQVQGRFEKARAYLQSILDSTMQCDFILDEIERNPQASKKWNEKQKQKWVKGMFFIICFNYNINSHLSVIGMIIIDNNNTNIMIINDIISTIKLKNFHEIIIFVMLTIIIIINCINGVNITQLKIMLMIYRWICYIE